MEHTWVPCMAQGHLMTVEIRGVDLILSLVPKMNKHEVPSYDCSLANNTTKGLRSGSIIFEKNPMCQPTTNMPEFIAKQDLCRPDSCSKQETNVRTFLARYKDDGLSYEIYIPFCCAKTSITVRQSKSLEDREIGKQFAPLWNSVERSDQNSLPWWRWRRCIYRPSARRPLTSASALRIEETVLENLCSNLLLWKWTVVYPCCTWHVCSWCFWWSVATGHLSSHTGQCVLAALSPPRLFLPPGLSSRPFCSFPFRWFLHFALSLTRGVIVHDAASCSKENSLFECGRPCDALSCLLFSALWLRCNQSLQVQETQSAKDIDRTCSKMFPIKATTCLQAGPMSLVWPVDPIARFDFSRSSLSLEVPNDDQQRGGLPASTRSRWRQDALQAPPQILQRTTGWDGLKYLKRLIDANNILCLQEVHGKDEYLQAIQVLAPRFWFFDIFIPDNENAGGSAICIHRDLLPEEAIVTHLITCQGRDHLVNIQSGRHNLVIVNVHFEPELTLRQLRGRLRLIHPNRPAYPNGVGSFLEWFQYLWNRRRKA